MDTSSDKSHDITSDTTDRSFDSRDTVTSHDTTDDAPYDVPEYTYDVADNNTIDVHVDTSHDVIVNNPFTTRNSSRFVAPDICNPENHNSNHSITCCSLCLVVLRVVL